MTGAAHDAIVVGAGPNGLAAAIDLARAGRSVLVYEAADDGRRRDAHRGADAARLRPRPLLDGPPAEPRVAVLPVARPRAARRSSGSTRRRRSRTRSTTGRSVGAGAGRRGHRRRASARTATPGARLFGPLVRECDGWLPAHPRAGRPPAAAPAAARPVRAAGAAAGRRASRGSAFREPAARALFAGLAAHSMLPLDRPLSGLVRAGARDCSPTPSAGRWPAAAAARSPTRSPRSPRRWAGRSSTGHRVDASRELPPARAFLLDVTPRQVARDRRRPAAGRLPPAARALPLRAGRLQGRLGARRPDPVARPRPRRRAATVHLGGTPARSPPPRPRSAAAGTRSGRSCSSSSRRSSTRRARPTGKHTAWAYCHVPNGSTVDMTDAHRGAGRAVRARASATWSSPARRRTPAAMEAHDANYVGGDINGGIGDWRQLFFRPVVRVEPVRDAGPAALPLLVVDAARRRRPRHVRPARRPGGADADA